MHHAVSSPRLKKVMKTIICYYFILCNERTPIIGSTPTPKSNLPTFSLVKPILSCVLGILNYDAMCKLGIPNIKYMRHVDLQQIPRDNY